MAEVSAAPKDVNKLIPSTMSSNDVQHYVDFIAAVEAEAKPKPAQTILRKHISDHFRRALRLDEKPSAPLTASKVLTKEEEERLFKNVFQLARDGVFPHGHTAHPEWLEALSRMYPLYMAHMWDETIRVADVEHAIEQLSAWLPRKLDIIKSEARGRLDMERSQWRS